MHAHYALTLAIAGLNTLLEPEATDPGDAAAIIAQAREAVAALEVMRERQPIPVDGPVVMALRLEQLMPGDEVLTIGSMPYDPPLVVAPAPWRPTRPSGAWPWRGRAWARRCVPCSLRGWGVSAS